MLILFYLMMICFHEFDYIHCCHFLVLYRFLANGGWVLLSGPDLKHMGL